MYKAVFSDFDGTLLTSDHRILPKTLDAIQRITKQGIPFTPISARSPLGIWPYAKLIENYNIIVAFSGALILDKNATPIYSVQIDPYDESAVYSPHKIQIIGETDEVIAIEQILKEKFPHLSICRSHANFLEVMHKSATKGNAVRFLEDYFHVKMEECVAFGDNFNDLDMLESVGLGVAMGNAPDEIKQAANRVTTSHNDDGIALILNEIFPE